MTAGGGAVRGVSLADAQWQTLLSSIHDKECTPFLGAGIAAPALPTGSQLARELAAEHHYPFRDTANLARVTQYIAVTHDEAFAKRLVQEKLRPKAQTHVASDSDPHAILASLDLPVYVTTNYDSLLYDALDRRHPGTVTREVARWNQEVVHRAGRFRAKEPTAHKPLVFHLHGHTELPASIVVTEDDYVEFVTAIAQDEKNVVVPPRVQEALALSSLLFVGYGMADWNFHVLLGLLVEKLAKRTSSRLSVSVQLPPDDELVVPERRVDAEEFLAKYLGAASVRIHWGDARAFLSELRERFSA